MTPGKGGPAEKRSLEKRFPGSTAHRNKLIAVLDPKGIVCTKITILYFRVSSGQALFSVIYEP